MDPLAIKFEEEIRAKMLHAKKSVDTIPHVLTRC